jgi:hypothetical protein
VAGCQATSINTPIHRSRLLDKLSVVRVGYIDMRAQAEVRSALRTDTPTCFRGCLWPNGGQISFHAAAPGSHLNGCHPRPVNAYQASEEISRRAERS